ncbi:MAG TPA: hypothetical protein PLJ35_07985 [Anaerolineae bacterium]|nr:hypothetical protein [Anaerolineae bacterium]
MLRRVLPPRYVATEGRLVDYEVRFDTTVGFPVNLYAFGLRKTYIPWDTWEAYYGGGPPRLPSTPPKLVEGTFALKTLPKEHERTLEDVTVRLRQETNVLAEQSWSIDAYDRYFRFISPAILAVLDDIMPYLQDPGAYHWERIKNMLVSYVDSAGLDYPRLSDPDYFEARRLDALNLWQALDGIANTLAAKWELGFGECGHNPDPDDFRLPNVDAAFEVGGWMLGHFDALRSEELPIPMSRFVELHRVELQPQQMSTNIQEVSDRFGPGAVPDVFGQIWNQRYGYDALLADLEKSLATPDQLIGLGWLYDLRTMR